MSIILELHSLRWAKLNFLNHGNMRSVSVSRGLTRMKVPFSARECGGLKNSFIDGKSTCCIDHSRWAHIVSASDSSSWSISLSTATSSSPVVVNVVTQHNTTQELVFLVNDFTLLDFYLTFTWLTHDKSYIYTSKKINFWKCCT